MLKQHTKEFLDAIRQRRWAMRPPLAERFWARVKKGAPDECWEWQGTKRGGYGRLYVNRKFVTASRFAYEQHYGAIDENLLVLHKCDNPACCNPAHLRQGTDEDNTDDKFNRNRQYWPRGDAHKLTKYPDAFVKKLREQHKTQTFKELQVIHPTISKGTMLKLLYSRKFAAPRPKPIS